MKIKVTKEHISNGKCLDPHRCMIAVAIKAAYPEVSYVSVRGNGITITVKGREDDEPTIRSHWAIPYRTAKLISRFDHGEELEPFSFSTKLIDRKELPAVDAKTKKSDSARNAKRRKALKAAGQKPPQYGLQPRMIGI